ncbi:MAG TPA: flagellar biosynthetic protein FliR [Pirellulales bacterium]|nr:flagellar biosynthetic protein FliR [Pirellulales bacterium]
MFELTQHHLYLFALVLTRTSGIVIAGPPFGTNELPTQVRVMLGLMLAALIYPGQIDTPVTPPLTVAGYIPALGAELFVGFLFGSATVLLFSGVQLAGQIVGQMSGMTLADLYSPGLDANVPLLSQLLYMLALAIFLLAGGHRLAMGGFLDTFQTIPPGSMGMATSLTDCTVTLLVQSFSLGIRVAAPATVALLLASLVLGIISRTLPQLNVMALGFGVNAMTTFGILSASLAGMAWLFQDEMEPALQTVLNALGAAAEIRER